MKGVMIAIVVVLVSPTTAYASHLHCAEVSDIVGRSQCKRLGSTWWMPSWVPALALEFGLAGRRTPWLDQVPRKPLEGSGSPGPTRRLDIDTLGPVLRMGVELVHGLYVRSQAELGVGAARDGSSSLVLGYGGVLGLHGRVGNLVLGTELLAGGRTSTRSMVESRDTTVTVTPTRSNETGVLEARVCGERWANPWMTVGACAGSSLLERGDYSLGVFVSFNARAYRGR